MNCLCNLFDDNTVWIVIIALIVLSLFCGQNDCGANRGCGCGC